MDLPGGRHLHACVEESQAQVGVWEGTQTDCKQYILLLKGVSKNCCPYPCCSVMQGNNSVVCTRPPKLDLADRSPRQQEGMLIRQLTDIKWIATVSRRCLASCIIYLHKGHRPTVYMSHFGHCMPSQVEGHLQSRYFLRNTDWFSPYDPACERRDWDNTFWELEHFSILCQVCQVSQN